MDAHSHSTESDSDDLGNNLDKVLKIRDDHGRQHLSDEDDDTEDEGINSYGRYRRMFDSSSSSEEAGEPEFSRETLRKVYELAMSLPSPENLVSAMKGSREKVEGSQKNLTVKWAPDVYDPPPTQLELILSRGAKQQKVPKKEKKSGKKAQKGKDFSRGGGNGRESSRGGGKDKKKKQHRGASGGSRRYDVFADDDGMESFSSGFSESAHESSKKDSSCWLGKDKKKQTRGMVRNFRRYDLPPSDDDDDDEDKEVKVGNVEAGSSDLRFCSSILKGSLNEVHHSVARALGSG